MVEGYVVKISPPDLKEMDTLIHINKSDTSWKGIKIDITQCVVNKSWKNDGTEPFQDHAFLGDLPSEKHSYFSQHIFKWQKLVK